MKLFDRYNRVNLVTTIVMMLITGIIYYQAISLILTNQKDKDLVVEEQEIFDYVNLNRSLPQTFQSDDQQITFSETKPGTVNRKFIHTAYFKKFDEASAQKHHRHNHANGRYEPGRALITSVTVGARCYRIQIIESEVETEDLIQLIFFITISVILLLLVVLLITNRLILNRLWQPFYSIMRELKMFNITDAHPIPKIATTIDEFNELNQAVLVMTDKAKSDYTDLKAFTENASHELLTPIAVINSKLDTLIQTENFNPQQSRLLNDLYGAVSRLSRLNQSLLLLVKIENRLLHDQQTINLRALIEEMLIQLEEIFQAKEIDVSSKLIEKNINANRYLIEILLSNLLFNSIRHNYKGGEVSIVLSGESLTISNTGETIALQDDKIFTRFHKSSGSEGSGLGLTISRQICENFGFSLTYVYHNKRHVFAVNFNGDDLPR